MIEVYRELKRRDLKTKMIIQVHDELIFEAPQTELDQATQMVRAKMESALDLKVPIKVDIGVGRSWYQAH